MPNVITEFISTLTKPFIKIVIMSILKVVKRLTTKNLAPPLSTIKLTKTHLLRFNHRFQEIMGNNKVRISR